MGWTKKKHKAFLVNIKEGCRIDVRLVGGTKWKNPFPVKKGVRTPQESYEQYKEWINEPDQLWLKASVEELIGKILGCWCDHKYCHGYYLVELADELAKEKGLLKDGPVGI